MLISFITSPSLPVKNPQFEDSIPVSEVRGSVGSGILIVYAHPWTHPWPDYGWLSLLPHTVQGEPQLCHHLCDMSQGKGI